MNDKISSNNSYGGHYNAHESKELLNTIELKDKFQQVFKNTGYAFVIDTEYLKVISECEQFLVKSGGSSIPDNFNKINIIEDRPIINLLDLSEEIQKEVSINIEEQNINKTNTNKPKNKVFIVHGHDDATKQEVARFIEKIGLESIILHEQASMNKTIIEKIEHYTQEADFAIILYTPCDKGRGALETNIEARDRARQNVVFEHGYLMARIGRKNVCAFVKGNIETPSDIAGIVYTPLDEFGGWKNKLIMELEVCGYAVKYI
ncbi:MAG: nucleotide-binding protein [Sulfurimonas sp.]|nr:nucleotide-binding protein [Sulfurimonas sp.]